MGNIYSTINLSQVNHLASIFLLTRESFRKDVSLFIQKPIFPLHENYNDERAVMKENITLIGMPGAGKSTVGIILAKVLSKGFIDTDVLIQINQGKPLQQIMDETGYMHLREIEEEEICKVNISNHIIATGGSAVYSEKAMLHLSENSTIVFLAVDFEEVTKRIHNFDSRGIAKKEGQTFRDLFDERQKLYNTYADMAIYCNTMTQDEVAEMIAQKYLK